MYRFVQALHVKPGLLGDLEKGAAQARCCVIVVTPASSDIQSHCLSGEKSPDELPVVVRLCISD